MSDPVAIALIGATGSFAMAALAAIMSILNNLIARKNSTELIAQKTVITTLEKNTNSIKDALVKVTGEAEFQKGLKIGQESGKS